MTWLLFASLVPSHIFATTFLFIPSAAFRTETGLDFNPNKGTTIFNIVHPKDLSRALELISNMVDTGYNGNGNNGSSSSMSSNSTADEPVFIRSSFPNRPDLGLCITLVRSEDNIAKCFNITLVKNSNSNGEEFNPSLPAIPSMVPQVSAVSSEASSQSNDSKAPQSQASQAPQASQPVANIQVPQTSIPQVQPNAGMMNNVVLNNSTVPVPPPAMTPVIPTVNAGVGGAAAGLPPQLLQLIQQLQQQPAQQQQIPLFNIAQYQQQLQLQQQIPIQNQLNLGSVLQGANLMGSGQPNASVSSQQGSFSGQQDQKGKDDTVYHYASG